MKYFRIAIVALLLLMLAGALAAQSRIAEITDVQGVRENRLRGMGLVIGLNKTGDKSALAQRLIGNMLRRENINALAAEIGTGNAAVVMVTAKLDPFRRPGSKIDVTISSLNDAKSLRGGTLLATHLKGPYGKTVYAIAEGPMIVGAIAAEGDSGSSVTINHPTVGKIPGGAMVEKGVAMKITDRRGYITLQLKNQDWKTAHNIQEGINRLFPAVAKAVDAGAVEIRLNESRRRDVTNFLAKIQDIRVVVHAVSKVVVDEKTGTILVGSNVRVSTVAIAQGKLSVTISETPLPVVAAPFTEGPAISSVPRSEVNIQEQGTALKVVEGGQSIARLTEALNAIGASPSQLISILQQMKSMGALHAELVVN
ncbi:MAG: flagellar basal body P-ring protein FlgI [Planctomycetota bacterium]